MNYCSQMLDKQQILVDGTVTFITAALEMLPIWSQLGWDLGSCGGLPRAGAAKTICELGFLLRCNVID